MNVEAKINPTLYLVFFIIKVLTILPMTDKSGAQTTGKYSKSRLITSIKQNYIESYFSINKLDTCIDLPMKLAPGS